MISGTSGSKATILDAEETLRGIARLPAPEGLADRVRAALQREVLQTAPSKARLLAWPSPRSSREVGWLAAGWLRAAAAAAIATVVVGGGWAIHARVQPAPLARSLPLPPRAATPGGFSSAGAMRTPQTLAAPTITAPAPHGRGSSSATKPIE